MSAAIVLNSLTCLAWLTWLHHTQYSWMDRERMCVCVYTHTDLCLGWKDMRVVILLGFLPTGPGSSFKVIPSVFMEEVETTFHYFIGKGGSHNLVATLT